MIRHIKLIRNIGAFDSESGGTSMDLRRLSLVYAENGRGKSTLSAILRSLRTGNPLPIVERRRLGSDQEPHVVLGCDGSQSNVMFQAGEWNTILPDVNIYDDIFVDDNVYSGLDVDSRHRQGLHDLVLGEQGVELSRRLDGLVSRITEHNTILSERAKAIPDSVLGGLSIDDFCALPPLAEIDELIGEVNRQINAARNHDEVRSKPLFKQIELPEFDIEAIEKVLVTDLIGIDKSAEARVQEHLVALGEKGETWVSEGMELLASGNNEICPFCGQDITGQELVDHYRAYFSEGYSQLKQEVSILILEVDRSHSGDVQAGFERSVGTVRDSIQFWTNYCDMASFEIDTEAIAEDWMAARQNVAEVLRTKQGAPLERLEMENETRKAVIKFKAHRQQIKEISDRLTAHNVSIQAVKYQVESADIDQLRGSLARLEATKARHSDEIEPLCVAYLQEVEEKASTEEMRAEARKELDEYRTNVFPKLQLGVNYYLELFNAGFRIGDFNSTNIGAGTGSSCTYDVVINEVPVAVRGGNVKQGQPSFRNTLSAGDRNTLALCLFFSSLDRIPDLENKIVVMDDPISSLDDHRSLATVQEVLRLSERAEQVIVLSHSKRFLSDLWGGAYGIECGHFEIAQTGDSSTIQTWDVSHDAITAHDQRHDFLQQYVADQSGDKVKVAAAIRPHLEGYLRVAYPGDFPKGKLLGKFIEECVQRIDGDDEILTKSMTQELHNINEYGKQYHHEASNTNSAELLGFVKRTLGFTRPTSG